MKPVSECDVSDRERLASYRKLRDTAFELLRGDEDHSIWEQMVTLFWRDATYRIFNEARRSASDARPNAAVSGLLGEYIDAAYLLFEVTGISRLTDEAQDDASRSLVSLPTILKLVRDNRELITREMFVAFDGTPYDWTPKEPPKWVSGVRWVAREPWEISQERHELFDRLSRRTPNRRARSDQVHSRVTVAIARRLSGPTISGIRAHRNKVISHAASHSSRAGLTPLALSLASIDSAHQSLLEATEALSVILLGEIMIGGPVPQPENDFLDRLHLPFAFGGDLAELEHHFYQHLQDRERWSRTAVEAVLGR
jgi:hypothetical protein